MLTPEEIKLREDILKGLEYEQKGFGRLIGGFVSILFATAVCGEIMAQLKDSDLIK